VLAVLSSSVALTRRRREELAFPLGLLLEAAGPNVFLP